MPPGTAGSPVPANSRSFGKYTLVVKLATGGMAEIFLARLSGPAGFEKYVVIKRILPHLADDEQFVNMFLDEARITVRISHPNVCQVYELGEVEGQYFIAMEYLEGATVTAVVRKLARDRRTSDLRLSVALLAQACEGLHHAHDLRGSDGAPIGVVHRDVSPQNLFVTVGGVLKVLDFGIAKAAGASSKTRTGTVKGKYAYMSPEQLRGEPLDRRADVFALGVVMFEALTGRRLFWRETDFLMFKAITEEPIPRASELRSDLPRALDAALARALNRDREARFPSARAFGEAINNAISTLGGPLPSAAIATEIERMFSEELVEHRSLVARCAEGRDTQPETAVREPGSRNVDAAQASLADAQANLAEAPTQSLPISEPRARLPLPAPESTNPRASQVALPAASLARASSPSFATMTSSDSSVSARPSTSDPVTDPSEPPTLNPWATPASGNQQAFTGMAPKQSPRSRTTIVLGMAIVVTLAAGVVVLARRGSGGGGDASGDARKPLVAANSGTPLDSPKLTRTPADAAVAPLAVVVPDAAAHVVDPVPDPIKPDPIKPDPDVPKPDPDVPKPDPDVPKTPPEHRPPPVRPPPVKPQPTAPGTITIDSKPWATIFVDGKKVGPTPVVSLSLSPGRHTVRAVSSAGGTKEFAVTIISGKEAPPKKLVW